MLKFFLKHVVLTLFLAVAALPAFGATWTLNPDGSGDAPTIQDAIIAASNGDVIILTPGVFSGPGNRDLDFLGKAVTVTSPSGELRTLEVDAPTVIDCGGVTRGVIFCRGEGPSSVLQGVTIRNGYSSGYGGGIACIYNSSPTIRNVWVHNNHARFDGGGLYCDTADPTVDNNLFSQNQADSRGGAIYCRNASPHIINNTLGENGALIEGGGIFTSMAGSAPVIENNIIVNGVQGEGLACANGSFPTVTCNDVFGNAGGNALCGNVGAGNFSSDPFFCGVGGSNNYLLTIISPATAANSPCGLRIGALPVFCDAVSVRETTWGAIKDRYAE